MVRGGDNDNTPFLHPKFFAAHAVRALSGLSPEGGERDIFRGIRGTQTVQASKRMLSHGLQGPPEIQRKSVWREWSERDGLLCFRDRIHVPNDPELRRALIATP